MALFDGPAIGAGAEVLLAADIRVVGEHATMAFPEVGMGELPCWGGTQRLPRAGVWRWRCACSSWGRRSTRACSNVPASRWSRPTRAYTRRSSRAVWRTARRVRRQPRVEAVLRGRDLTLADGHRLESDLNLLLSTTRDRVEGIAAFFDKRPPKFEGE